MKRTWPPFLVALLLLSCGRPSDLDRARALIDSVRMAERADSLVRAAIADSLSDGPHTYRDANGMPIMEGRLLNQQRQGLWTSYFPDGKVKSRSEFIDGEPHGLVTVFHANGNLYYSGQHRHGTSVGEWRFFDERGILAKTVTYDSSGVQIPTR